jgi:hypothetical protein
MKVLFLDPEQYVDFESEPSNYQVRLPFLNSGAVEAHSDFVFQRTLRAEGREAMNRAALAAAESFAPDLVVNSLAWPAESIDAATLDAMRARGTKVLSVFWDTHINPLPHELEIFLASDVVLVMDSLAGYLRYRLLREHMGRGAMPVFSPIAVFTDVLRPASTAKDIDVLLLGSNEGFRKELAAILAERLPQRGIRFSFLGGLVDEAKPGAATSPAWIDWPSYAAAINRAKICLSSQTRTDRLQIKGKIFDFLACGTFCLTDANPELEHFLPPECVATYRDPDDCIAQIERYLADDAARQAIARAGHSWFNAVYDYRAFWRSIADGLRHGAEHLPILPGIEKTYESLKQSQALVGRAQLATLSQLAHIVGQSRDAKRLSVRALGSYRGVNILSVDERFIVASDGFEIDFMEIDGELHALLPDLGLVKLEAGEAVGGRASRLIRTGSIEAAKRVIESLFS